MYIRILKYLRDLKLDAKFSGKNIVVDTNTGVYCINSQGNRSELNVFYVDKKNNTHFSTVIRSECSDLLFNLHKFIYGREKLAAISC